MRSSTGMQDGLFSSSMMRSLTMIVIMVMTLSTGILIQPALAADHDEETPKERSPLIAELFLEYSLGIGRFDGRANFKNLPSVSTGGPLVAVDVLVSWLFLGAYGGLIWSDDNQAGAESSLGVLFALLVGNTSTGQILLFDFGIGFSSVLPLGEILEDTYRGREGIGYLVMGNLSLSLPRNWVVSIRLIYNFYLGLKGSSPNTETDFNRRNSQNNGFDNSRNNGFDDSGPELTGDTFSDFMYFLTIGKRVSF